MDLLIDLLSENDHIGRSTQNKNSSPQESTFTMKRSNLVFFLTPRLTVSEAAFLLLQASKCGDCT